MKCHSNRLSYKVKSCQFMRKTVLSPIEQLLVANAGHTLFRPTEFGRQDWAKQLIILFYKVDLRTEINTTKETMWFSQETNLGLHVTSQMP